MVSDFRQNEKVFFSKWTEQATWLSFIPCRGSSHWRVASRNGLNKLKEPVPAALQCKKTNCSFAPEGHKKHGATERNYTVFESRLIIQYLVHYDMISYGKGLTVWETMNSRGYLTHRTPLSLNNYSKRTLLKDVDAYKLPRELEIKFTALRPK